MNRSGISKDVHMLRKLQPMQPFYPGTLLSSMVCNKQQNVKMTENKVVHNIYKWRFFSKTVELCKLQLPHTSANAAYHSYLVRFQTPTFIKIGNNSVFQDQL